MQRYNKIVNQANKTKKDILDDTMFMICNQRVPLIDRVRTEGHPRVFRELSVRIYFSCIYASKLPLFLSIAIMKFPLHFLFL